VEQLKEIQADEWSIYVPFANSDTFPGIDFQITKEHLVKRLTDRQGNSGYKVSADLLFHPVNYRGEKAITVMNIICVRGMSDKEVDEELGKISGLY
jgi:hypothetical protein